MSTPKAKTPGSGRVKGTPNRVTLEREKQIAQSGLTPLEYMLSILRDPSESKEVRMMAAKDAAPYVHPRLAQVESKSEVIVKKEVSADPITPELWEKTYGPSPSAH